MSVDILEQLTAEECHWEVLVPRAAGSFFGHQFRLSISTDWTADRSGPVPASSSELALARFILSNLLELAKDAEVQFGLYQRSSSSTFQHICNPRIWIDREAILQDGQGRWALVVHRTDWPDFGWHIEFEGSRFLEIWAGS